MRWLKHRRRLPGIFDPAGAKALGGLSPLFVPRAAPWTPVEKPIDYPARMLHPSGVGWIIDLCLISIAFIALGLFLATSRRHPGRNLSPEKIVSHEGRERAPVDAETLFRLIGERLRRIQIALQSSPSGIEVEMCALGYKACVDDTVTLVRLIEEDLPRSGTFRRLRLKLYRRRATKLLRRVRESLNHRVTHASPQKQS